jgi:hypothetical protein
VSQTHIQILFLQIIDSSPTTDRKTILVIGIACSATTPAVRSCGPELGQNLPEEGTGVAFGDGERRDGVIEAVVCMWVSLNSKAMSVVAYVVRLF